MTKALDLGCGATPQNVFSANEVFGVDIRQGLGSAIKIADLAVDPIPFDSEFFDFITAHDFIEHIPRVIYTPHRRNSFVELMNEVFRVLRPNGLFLSMTPAFPHPAAYRDPTHVNIITEETFPLYFGAKHRWASLYGFTGSFEVTLQEWRGPHLLTVLKKAATHNP